jgi:hypothetical protein
MPICPCVLACPRVLRSVSVSKNTQIGVTWRKARSVVHSIRFRIGVVGVAEWLRHLVVAQKTVGSTPTAHPFCAWQPTHAGLAVLFCAFSIMEGAEQVECCGALAYHGRDHMTDAES